jgi:DNA ligase (NAD+)
MLSLANAFSEEEVRRVRRTRDPRSLEVEHVDYAAEPKLDGVAIALRYEHGRLARPPPAATAPAARTSPPMCARSRPFRCAARQMAAGRRARGARRNLHAAGRLFEATQRTGAGRGRRKTFVNPRNAAAGSLRQLDPG